MDTQLIFAVLGPVFLLLGIIRCVSARKLHPQAKAWLSVGAIFTAVAVWLWFNRVG
jgi:uncharacterized membrane protein HdeD (DUF308 family)